MIRLEKCPVCQEDNWKDLDYMRNQDYWYHMDYREEGEPVGFKICLNCAFVTYDYIEEERLAESYDRQRPAVQGANIVTCNRKNEYHRSFLEDVEIKNNVLDIGSAQGAFLYDLKTDFERQCKGETGYYNIPNRMDPDKEWGHYEPKFCGTEYARSFANYGRLVYDLDLGPEIDKSIKYNLVSCYHVLEHLQNPRERLQEMVDILADDGLLYLSVPTWFDLIEEWSGGIIADFEIYFHLNHVNVFSEQSFLNLLSVVGLDIIKTDKKMYGYTVLCKKADKKDIVKENPDNQIKWLNDVKLGLQKMAEQKHLEAIEICPKLMDAYLLMSLNKDNMKEFDEQIRILNEAFDACGRDPKIVSQLAKTYFQWSENDPIRHYYSNNIKKAEALFVECIKLKPGAEDSHYFMGLIEGNYKKDTKKALYWFDEAIRINPNRFGEVENLKGAFCKYDGEGTSEGKVQRKSS